MQKERKAKDRQTGGRTDGRTSYSHKDSCLVISIIENVANSTSLRNKPQYANEGYS